MTQSRNGDGIYLMPSAALIRHGDYHQRGGAPSALQPFPLTSDGMGQTIICAQIIHQMLRRHDLTTAPIIQCSPQLRAWQTADGIATHLRKLGHHIDDLYQTPALSERSVGTLANLTVAEIEAVLENDPRHHAPPKGWKSDSAYCLPYPGAESLTQAGARVAAHIQDTLTTTPSDILQLFIGHGASFRHGAHHLGILTQKEIAQLSMHHAQPLLIRYNRHGIWEHFDGSWKVRPVYEDVAD